MSPHSTSSDLYVLQMGSVALLLLVSGLALFHLVFRPGAFLSPRLERLQERMRLPALGVVYLLPMFWLSSHLAEIYSWYYALQALVNYTLSLTGAEFILCFLLDAPSGPRVSPVLQRLIRLPIYVGPGLVVLSVIFGLPIFQVDFQARVGAVILLYLALHLSYTYIVKGLPWRHFLALTLRDRLRLWIYALLLGSVGYFAVVHLDLCSEKGSNFLLYFRASLGFLAGSALSEGLLVCIFDFYFPEIRKVDVPHLFRDLARGLAFLAVICLTAIIFLKKDLSSLLVGSAVLSVALGFALQETLGNFFAGLALRLARPYTLGDRLDVFGMSGSVQKIDWRSTAILNNQGDLIIFPNSKLAQEPLINHSSPTSNTGRFIEVGLHYRHAPNVCKKVLLEAVHSVPEVLTEPTPEVYIMNFGEYDIVYRLRFFILDFAERFRIDSKVREAIWYNTTRHGIEIPFPIRNVYHREPDQGIDVAREVRGLLDTVDFFKVLHPEDLERLARRAHFNLYAAGEKVCVQGEPGDSFYIIKTGILDVTAADSDGEIFLNLELRAGQYFGEMALLTGEPRSATVRSRTDAELIRLGKEDLRHILRVNPQVEEMISQVLAQRKLQTQQARVEAEEERITRALTAGDSGEGMEQLTQQFLRKIRDFFSY